MGRLPTAARARQPPDSSAVDREHGIVVRLDFLVLVVIVAATGVSRINDDPVYVFIARHAGFISGFPENRACHVELNCLLDRRSLQHWCRRGSHRLWTDVRTRGKEA